MLYIFQKKDIEACVDTDVDHIVTVDDSCSSRLGDLGNIPGTSESVIYIV